MRGGVRVCRRREAKRLAREAAEAEDAEKRAARQKCSPFSLSPLFPLPRRSAAAPVALDQRPQPPPPRALRRAIDAALAAEAGMERAISDLEEALEGCDDVGGCAIKSADLPSEKEGAPP
mmetsp:Transcript_14868/g.47441  ORF Transcript_14868/g.47441 Transcript_14868/m.47441 type:complete len:120 (-) Transcript_14868:28-387(-)